jgi:hypothetical protein
MKRRSYGCLFLLADKFGSYVVFDYPTSFGI